jgi:hypothetical protein
MQPLQPLLLRVRRQLWSYELRRRGLLRLLPLVQQVLLQSLLVLVLLLLL